MRIIHIEELNEFEKGMIDIYIEFEFMEENFRVYGVDHEDEVVTIQRGSLTLLNDYAPYEVELSQTVLTKKEWEYLESLVNEEFGYFGGEKS